ncbi:hypothetical protein [Saccharopolyspora pogona]|uniref:hypothetical protein n=1 Tax=Saccharopolyspora pogona TaxID=333966 RepID=UPI001689F071|nr:hypothetical protein [Saccharopolyspora pogona]
MDNEIHETLKKAVKTAAIVTADEWSGVIESVDVEQELWLKLLESPNSASKLAEMNEAARKKSLLRMGKQIAAVESSSYELFSDQVHYSTDEVREMLEAGALVGEGFNSDDERIDFEIAIEVVRDGNPQYIEYLWGYYELDEFSLHSSTNKERLGRAVRKLTDHMNNTTKIRNERYDGPGSREAMSNARAIGLSGTTWDGPKRAKEAHSNG